MAALELMDDLDTLFHLSTSRVGIFKVNTNTTVISGMCFPCERLDTRSILSTVLDSIIINLFLPCAVVWQVEGGWIVGHPYKATHQTLQQGFQSRAHPYIGPYPCTLVPAHLNLQLTFSYPVCVLH